MVKRLFSSLFAYTRTKESDRWRQEKRRSRVRLEVRARRKEKETKWHLSSTSLTSALYLWPMWWSGKRFTLKQIKLLQKNSVYHNNKLLRLVCVSAGQVNAIFADCHLIRHTVQIETGSLNKWINGWMCTVSTYCSCDPFNQPNDSRL